MITMRRRQSVGCVAELQSRGSERRRLVSESAMVSRQHQYQLQQSGSGDTEVGNLVRFKVEKAKAAFKDRLVQLEFHRTEGCMDLKKFITYLMPRLVSQLKAYLALHSGIKFLVTVECEYEKVVPAPEADPNAKKIGYLKTQYLPLRHTSDIPSASDKVVTQLANRHVNYMRDASGLRLRNVQHATLQIAKHTPMMRSDLSTASGSNYVELPNYLARKHAIVNVQNKDNRCFAYAMLSAKYPAKANGFRPQHYIQHFADHPCFDRITYPVQLADLANVEQTINMPFNVYSYYDDDGKARYPVYLSRIDVDAAYDLMYFKGHYAWIRNFSKLMHDITKSEHKKLYCKRCLGHFTAQHVLDVHKMFCRGDEGCQQVYTMPPEGTTLKFRNVRHMQHAPFAIYVDFEALTTPIKLGDANGNNKVPSTAYQKHMPISVGMKLVSTCPAVNLEYEDYTGDDVTEFFLHRMLDYEQICKEYLFDERRMIISDVDAMLHDDATVCYVCNKPFTPTNPKVRDHDHVSGMYRGAAHHHCNLLLRRTIKIPVFIHNFRGYDSHLMMFALGLHKDKTITVIGQGMEKYLTLTWSDHLVFKDSYQFCQASLDRLVECLMKAKQVLLYIGGRGGFKHTIAAFEADYTAEQVDLLLRKGVYPYDYMKDKSRFLLPALPPQAAFASRLKASTCSDADYAHAKKVWTTFRCNTFRDYHDLYLKTDVLLLADVFESFRYVCESTYGLDPSHYVSAPHLTWDAMLKMTEVEIELLSDPAMFDLVNQGLRGGMCMISCRHAEANNKYMGDLYDASKPSSYIMYLDANNLYGIAMSQPMPHSNFRWLEEHEFEALDWLAQTTDQPIGYIVECDLDYPKELHDAHNEYPLAPERVRVKKSMLSKTAKEIRGKYDVSHNNTTKLVPTLFTRERYTLHYRNLRFYMEQGLVLRKVHRVLMFLQERWLAPYIEKNQNLRAASTDEFEKKFYKDMNNSAYGKTCENLTRRTDIRIVTDAEKCDMLTQKAQCMGFRIFSEDIAAVELRKVLCLINKPTYVGFTVLEVSKLHMYEFYYEFIKKRLYPEPGKARLLFTDTDSLAFHITTEDVYADFFAHRELFDFSNFPKDSPFYTEENKMVIGKMKDEAGGKQIKEFVGLRPKMYSYTTVVANGPQYKETKRAKGIQNVALQDIHHADYKRQLFAPAENRVTVRRIGQRLHKVFSHESKKRGLCAFDDKRFILPDRISTLAYGHWRIAAEHNVDVQTAGDLFQDDDDDDEDDTTVLSAQQAHRGGMSLQQVSGNTVQMAFTGRDPREAFASLRESHRRVTTMARAAAAAEPPTDDQDDDTVALAVPDLASLFPASKQIMRQSFLSYLADGDT